MVGLYVMPTVVMEHNAWYFPALRTERRQRGIRDEDDCPYPCRFRKDKNTDTPICIGPMQRAAEKSSDSTCCRDSPSRGEWAHGSANLHSITCRIKFVTYSCNTGNRVYHPRGLRISAASEDNGRLPFQKEKEECRTNTAKEKLHNAAISSSLF